jgi:hypothetical protein
MTRMREWLPRKTHYISTSRHENQLSWTFKSSSTLSTAYLHQDQNFSREEMSTEMNPTEVSREVSIDHPEKRNKEKRIQDYIGCTWLRLYEDSLLWIDDTLLQPEGPVHHGDGSLDDEDDQAGPAEL